MQTHPGAISTQAPQARAVIDILDGEHAPLARLEKQPPTPPHPPLRPLDPPHPACGSASPAMERDLTLSQDSAPAFGAEVFIHGSSRGSGGAGMLLPGGRLWYEGEVHSGPIP